MWNGEESKEVLLNEELSGESVSPTVRCPVMSVDEAEGRNALLNPTV
jgi:hypothetical protein